MRSIVPRRSSTVASVEARASASLTPLGRPRGQRSWPAAPGQLRRGGVAGGLFLPVCQQAPPGALQEAADIGHSHRCRGGKLIEVYASLRLDARNPARAKDQGDRRRPCQEAPCAPPPRSLGPSGRVSLAAQWFSPRNGRHGAVRSWSNSRRPNAAARSTLLSVSRITGMRSCVCRARVRAVSRSPEATVRR